MEQFTYNHLNMFLKEKFGERVLKVPINAGFTCPNRDGTCGTGGCIFCDEIGGSNKKQTSSITEQVINHLSSYRGQRANKFIVYFQNFTNTYHTINILKQKYDEALSCSEKIVGLAIATRPDCITEDIAKLIASYKNKYYVWIELGLQTSNDNTAKIINRGYNKDAFAKAVKILNKYDIDIVTHIMVGLPNETKTDVLNTVDFLNIFNLMGIKIHSTYVLKNTILGKMFLDGTYEPLNLNYYIETVIEILTKINPKFIIHRISGDAPKENLLAPNWNTHKKLVLNNVENIMKEKKFYQGMYFKNKNFKNI